MTQNNEREALIADAEESGAKEVSYTGDYESDWTFTIQELEKFAKLQALRLSKPTSQNEHPKQIPDGGKLIGKVSEMGVVWYKQNPHAHPIGTEFYAVLPTTSLTSETNTEVG